jgi:cbb3-type cytochrome oxidase subunit 1
MHHLIAALLVLPTVTGKEASLLILRWFHFIAGILWIGLLYFFNLVNMPFMKTWMRLPNRRSLRR